MKYVLPLISGSDICINPVNWHTDATPATRSSNDNSPAIRMEEAYAPYTKL